MSPRLTELNLAHLNRRFAIKDGVYVAHEPIWGYRKGCTESGHLVRFARTLQILRWLCALEFQTFCDIGAAEGYTTSLVRALLKPKRPVVTDLSLEAALRAHELFGVLSCSADAAHLPFEPDSFDVVLCSEVIEHLEHPLASISELLRVARRYVLITTEVSAWSPLLRLAILKTRNTDEPHFDRNVWLGGDFQQMFGKDVRMVPQFLASVDRHDPEDVDFARQRLLKMASAETVSRSTIGLVVLIRKDRSLSLPMLDGSRDKEFIDLLFAGPLSLPRSEPETWSASDRGKLSVRVQTEGVGTLDLVSATRDTCPAENSIGSSPCGQRLSDLFLESNVASALSYPFWRVVRRALRG